MTKQTTIIIQQDLFAESPRDPEFSDNLTTMACYSRNYNLGDEDGTDELEHAITMALQAVFEKRFKAKAALGLDVWDEGSDDWDNPLHCNFDHISDVKEAIEIYRENEHLVPHDLRVVIKPLYLLDHSGLAISNGPFSCSWDSGLIGYQFVTYGKLKAEYGCKRVTERNLENIYRTMRAEVEIYDTFLRGEVYGFIISEHDEGQDPKEGEYVDSCHGFYGSDWQVNGMVDHWPKEYTTYNIIDEHNTELQYAA